MAVSWAGIMALVLMSGAGGQFRDLVSALSAEDYFAYRGIDVNQEQMLKLAQKEPGEPRERIAQLLAIRWLGEKKVQAARGPLEQVAQGKLGKDPQSFARDYARWALARIIDKPPTERGLPKDSLRESLAWFPEDVTFFGAIDLRGLGGLETVPVEDIRQLLAKSMPKEVKQEVYKFADAVGNLRVDRLSFGTAMDGQPKRRGRIFVRITGLGDHKRLAQFIRDTAATPDLRQEKGATGEPITVLTHPARAPAFALIGDTDLLFAGYEAEENAGEVLELALGVRNGKPSLLTAEAAKVLGQINAQAAGFLAGNVPDEIRRELGRPAGLPVVPHRLQIELVADNGLRFQLRAGMDKEADAQALAGMIEGAKPQALRAIEAFNLKPELAKPLTQAIEGVSFKAEGTAVNGSIHISNEAIKAIGSWFMTFAKTIE